METTPLDLAYAAMMRAPDDDAARLAFFGLLAGTELFLLLDEEPVGEDVAPTLFEVEGARYMLAFDREERLTAFTGAEADYAALPGRGLVNMIAGQGIGLAFNPEAPSSWLIPPEAVDWLAGTLAHAPSVTEARPVAFQAPQGAPQPLLAALDQRLAASAGLAQQALLAAVEYEGGARSHMLAFVGAAEGAEPALAAAVGEALTFSGVEAGWLDVAFLAEGEAALAAMMAVALRFDLPEPVRETPVLPPAAPGMDPAKPPKLR